MVVVWKRSISCVTSGAARNGDCPVEAARMATISRSLIAARWNVSAFESSELCPASKFVELGTDVAKVPLKILLHRALVAIPLGTLIGGGREPVVGSAEKIFSERQFHERGSGDSAGVT